MAKETFGPFDEYTEVEVGSGRTSKGTFGVQAGEILSFDGDGKKVIDVAVKPEKAPAKAPAKAKAPTKKK